MEKAQRELVLCVVGVGVGRGDWICLLYCLIPTPTPSVPIYIWRQLPRPDCWVLKGTGYYWRVLVGYWEGGWDVGGLGRLPQPVVCTERTGSVSQAEVEEGGLVAQ